MATGRADFWYGRPFLLTDIPDEFNTQDAPTANWAYTHAVNPAAHHGRYTDAEAVLAMGPIGNLNTLHHNRYSDGEAQEAMGAKANYNPLNHDRYTDAEADARAALLLPIYVNRGDPAANDYTTGNFTKDAAWHLLDLSGVVPSGAQAVVLGLYASSPTAGAAFWLRRYGNVNTANVSGVVTQVASISTLVCCVVAVDAARRIEYNAAVVTWTILSMTICGWLK